MGNTMQQYAVGQEEHEQEDPDLTSSSAQENRPWVWALRHRVDCREGLNEKEILAQQELQRKLPVPILDDVLYLGDSACAADIGRLKELGITFVLNMAGPLAVRNKTVRAYRQEGIVYKGIAALDNVGYPLLQKHWQEAKKFIQSALGGGNKCLVHCLAGMNRSALIVAAYYMLQTQTPVLETVRHVRKRRGNVALQNSGFQEQLVALARARKLLDAPIPPGYEEMPLASTKKNLLDETSRTSLPTHNNNNGPVSNGKRHRRRRKKRAPQPDTSFCGLACA